MTVSNPLLLLALLLAIPIVVAFLRRPPPTRRVVSSVLLMRALGNAPVRRRRPPLRELIALALMLCALGLAVLGIATRPDPPPRDVIVVMDTSASAVRRRAVDMTHLRAALQAHPTAAITVVTTAPPQVVLEHSMDHSHIMAVAQNLPHTGEDGDFGPLLAPRCAVERPPLLLALFDAVEGIDVNDVGCAPWIPNVDAAANGGVTDLAARRVDGLGLVEVLVSTEPDMAVALLADGQSVATVTVSGSTMVHLNLPGVQTLTAVALDGGTWAGDDQATVDIPAPAQVHALLVSQASDGFAAAALQSHPGVTLTVSETAVPREGGWDLVVVDAPVDVLPPTRHVVWLGVHPSPLGLQTAGQWQRPDVFVVQPDDPLLQYVDATSLFVEQSHILTPPDGATVLLGSDRGPVCIRHATDDMEMLVLGFAPGDSDLVLRTGFINLMANVVEWARPSSPMGRRGEGVLSALETTAKPLSAFSPATTRRPWVHTVWIAGAVFVLLWLEWMLQWAWRVTR